MQTAEQKTTNRQQTGADETRSENPDIRPGRFFLYLVLGVFFGVVLTKSEVISWFRIQEMFRFQSFHMYGVIGGAVLVGAISIQVIRRCNVRDLNGHVITIPEKEWSPYRYWFGGISFGIGWALLGACPGPIFALIGNGISVYVLALVSAVAGTWVYGYLRPTLPH